ncbi:unnamed protein product, partial [Plutella xylostella]
ATNASGAATARARLEVSADEAPSGTDPPTFLRRLQDLTVRVGTRTRLLVEILSDTHCKVRGVQHAEYEVLRSEAASKPLLPSRDYVYAPTSACEGDRIGTFL